MRVLQNWGVADIAEHMRGDKLRQGGVEMRHVGQAAPEHDGVGVEDVDDLRQRPGQALTVLIQRRARPFVPRFCPRR